MLDVYKHIALAADSSAPVLIVGESGTGKELVARAIHTYGKRAREPFIAVNCGALVDSLLESELFGHVRGAFTGAVADRKGIFEQAGGGTVLLDEIGDTSPALQVKLLRVLEEGDVRPVGASRSIHATARVIAATNVALEQAVAEGTVPTGSVLPIERDRHPRAAAARATRRHSAAHRAVSRGGLPPSRAQQGALV